MNDAVRPSCAADVEVSTIEEEDPVWVKQASRDDVDHGLSAPIITGWTNVGPFGRFRNHLNR